MNPSNCDKKTGANLEELTLILEKYISFLNPFKSLLNTHNVQFLIENHWSNPKILSEILRKDLEVYLKRFESSSKSGDYHLTPNLIKHYHLIESQRDNENTFLHSLDSLFLTLNSLNKIWDTQVVASIDDVFNEDMKNNVSSIALNEFQAKFEQKFSILEKQNRFMNKKKSYEVDIMSKFVAKLCKMLDLATVYYYLF